MHRSNVVLSGDLLGMTEERAIKAIAAEGMVHRIINRDGVDLGCLCDYRTDRVKLEIFDNLVTKWKIG